MVWPTVVIEDTDSSSANTDTLSVYSSPLQRRSLILFFCRFNQRVV